MLEPNNCSHFDRVDTDIKKFHGVYKNEELRYHSGANEFHGDTQSSTGLISKETKHTKDGLYLSSGGGSSRGDNSNSGAGSRRHPIGTKAMKGKCKGELIVRLI